jgi:ATP-dependent DNA helicase RecQ
VGLQRFFAGSGQIEAEQVEQVLQVVQEHAGPVELKELKEQVDLSQTKLTTALSRLEAIGMVEIQPGGAVAATGEVEESAAAALAAAQEQERHQRRQQSRVEMMRSYAETHDCRRAFLLNYFGEPYSSPCGHCDNCEAGRVQPDDEAGEQSIPFPLNSRVAHTQWGEGMVMRYEGDKVTVLFDAVGYKTLALEVVQENQLLTAVGA